MLSLARKLLASIRADRLTYEKVWGVAWPIIVGGLADNINTAINTAFVGRMGEVAIGAVSMGGLFYYNFVIIALGLAAGVQIIVGRRNGEENYLEAGRVVTHSLLLFSLISLLLLGLVLFIADDFLRFLISSDRIYIGALRYTHIRIFGIVIYCLTLCLRSFFIGITQTRVIIIVTLLTALTNVLMDYVLIFGRFGLPKLGIEGAAYASIIAEVVGLLGYFAMARFWQKVKKYSLFHFRHFRWEILGNILRIGSPLMLQSLASFSSWLLFFVLIERMGERELAVSSIIKNIYLLYLIPIWGFGSASNALTSNLMGQGKADEVPEMLRKIVNMATGTVSIFTLVILIYPAPFIALFNPDPELVAATVGPLRVVAVALLLFPAATVLFNGISGAGDTKASMVIEILTICVYVGYIYLSSRVLHFGLTGVWVAEIWYMLFMGLGALYRLSSGKWRRARV